MLLDTNALLWLMWAPERLGPTTHRLLSEATAVHVSAISHVEIQIKQLNGKLRVPDNFAQTLAAQGFSALPLREAHAYELANFPELVGHDPFHRQLVAQASVERHRLITADDLLLSLGYDWILDARL